LLHGAEPIARSAVREPEVMVVRGRLATLWAFLRWAVGAAVARLTGRLTAQEKGRRLRVLFESLGGLWVKAGQLLSLRRDIFDDAFCTELAKLQDRAVAFPPEDVRRIVEEDLGLPLELVFDSFDMEQIAAASIGQTHRARLRHGGAVAVKVQRPGIGEQFRRDLSIIRAIASFYERAGILPFLRWREMVAELEEILREELDYRLEASSIRRMRKSLRRHRIIAPRVFQDYCTRRILVMEFIDGVLMSDYIQTVRQDPVRADAWRRENHVEAEKVAWRLYHSLCRQVFEDNLFHGDLHPGNILLLRNSRVALIDFGSIGSLEVSFLRKYSSFSEAMAHKEYDKAADLLLLLSPMLPSSGLEAAKAEIIRWLRNWAVRAGTEALPYHEKSFTQAMGSLSRIMTGYRIPAAWELLRIDRTWLAIDASLMHLHPNASFMKLARRYWRQRHRRAELQLLDPRSLRAGMTGVLRSAMTLPGQIEDKLFYEGEILRQRARTFDEDVDKMGRIFGALVGLFALGLVLGDAILLTLFLHQHVPSLAPSWLGEDVREVAARMPHLDRGVWITGLVVVFLLAVRALFLRREMLRRETQTAWRRR
jgi:ubiquinone biosynthesis protein